MQTLIRILSKRNESTFLTIILIIITSNTPTFLVFCVCIKMRNNLWFVQAQIAVYIRGNTCTWKLCGMITHTREMAINTMPQFWQCGSSSSNSTPKSGTQNAWRAKMWEKTNAALTVCFLSRE